MSTAPDPFRERAAKFGLQSTSACAALGEDLDLPPPPPGYQPIAAHAQVTDATHSEPATQPAAASPPAPTAAAAAAAAPVSFAASPNFKPPVGSTGPPPAGGSKTTTAQRTAGPPAPTPAPAPQPVASVRSAAKRFVADEQDLPPPPPPPASAATTSDASKVAAPASAPAPAPAARSPAVSDVPPPPPPADDAPPPPPPALSPLQEELLSAAFKGQAGLKHVSAPAHAQSKAAAPVGAAKQPALPSPPLPAPTRAVVAAPSISAVAASPPALAPAAAAASASAGSSKAVCDRCHLVIVGSVLELGDGSSFHPACFLCVRCKQPISDAIISVPNAGAFHESCVLCAACGRNVSKEGFATNPITGAIFCAAHAKQAKNNTTAAAPASEQTTVCAGCRAPLNPAAPSEPLISTGSALFHARCLQCCACHCSLAGSSAAFEQSGKHYCQSDFQRLFGRTCDGCGKPIVSGAILSIESGTAKGTIHFHDACFTCNRCKEKLASGQFSLQHGKIICERC